MIREPRIRNAGGFTLIEVMLATVIGSMVIAAVSMISVESLRLQRSTTKRIKSRWMQQRVMQQFEQDVNAEVTWFPEEVPTVILPEEPERLIEVLSLADVPSTDGLFRTRMPAKVAYLVSSDEKDPTAKALWRELTDLTKPSLGPVRLKLAAGLDDVRIEVHGAHGWDVAAMEPSDRPDALRLIFHWKDDGLGTIVRTVVLRSRDRARRMAR